jgi:hypothetical protein
MEAKLAHLKIHCCPVIAKAPARKKAPPAKTQSSAAPSGPRTAAELRLRGKNSIAAAGTARCPMSLPPPPATVQSATDTHAPQGSPKAGSSPRASPEPESRPAPTTCVAAGIWNNAAALTSTLRQRSTLENHALPYGSHLPRRTLSCTPIDRNARFMSHFFRTPSVQPRLKLSCTLPMMGANSSK